MIKLTNKKPEKYTGDMVAYFVGQRESGAPVCENTDVQQMVDRAFSAGDFIGREGQSLLYYPEPGGQLAAKRVLVVGLGKNTAKDGFNRETFRKAGGVVSATALKTKAGSIMARLPEDLDFNVVEMAECLTEGLIMGAYQFRKYKSKNGQDEDEPGRIDRISLSAADTARKGMQLGRTAALAACVARDMANEPGNKWTPSSFAEFGLELAAKFDLSCKVLTKAAMKRLGMGGLLGVNSGSAEPPQLVILEYRTSRQAPTVLLVGKGLTFDSGGISIKPSKGMEEMKYDMCGGAAVFAVMQAIGTEKPKGLNVVAIVPATENLPGPAALKPGDIISQYGGKTVEVVNTDAEGRLVLADALAYGIEKFKPAAVFDIATLTGAVVVGLGHHRTGLLTNRDDLAQKLIAAGDRSGEPLWRLPLGREYAEQLESEVADIKNIGNRTGGTITAAAFLQHFVGDTPWAHLDIAGTAYNFTEKPYIPKGPSGTGVRTILELLRHYTRV